MRKDICMTQKYKGTGISLEFISCKEMERERKAWLCSEEEVSHLLFQALYSQNVCNLRFTFPTQFNLVKNNVTSLLFRIWTFSQPLSLPLSQRKKKPFQLFADTKTISLITRFLHLYLLPFNLNEFLRFSLHFP